MSSKTFLLVTSWSWDHHNTDIATITEEIYSDEEYEALDRASSYNFVNLLKSDKYDWLLKRLQRIQKAQNGGTEADGKGMHCLYELISPCLTNQHTLERGESLTLPGFKLKPLCLFDDYGNPVPLKEEK